MASPRVAALLQTVAEARVLLAIGTGAAAPRGAWLVRGPDYWRERGCYLVARGQPHRPGPWRVQVVMFASAARPVGAGRGGRRSVGPLLCGLCSRPPDGDYRTWAAGHVLCIPGTNRRHV